MRLAETVSIKAKLFQCVIARLFILSSIANTVTELDRPARAVGDPLELLRRPASR
jgi:hypothetical protein